MSAPTQLANPMLASQRQKIIETKQFLSLYQKWDLFIPFIELGIKHLCRTKGICTMIVPYPLTNQLYAQKLRQMLLSEFSLFELVDLNGTKIFDKATVSNCIPFVQRANPDGIVHLSHIDKNLAIARSFTKTYDQLVQDNKTLVWNVSDENRDSQRHLDMHVLGDFCYISVGMVLNADEKTAKGAFTKEDLISDTQDAIHSRKYIEAKDIEKYHVKRLRYLEWDTDRCPAKLRRQTFPELYNQKKLMFNRLGALQVHYDAGENLLHSDSMFSAVRWIDLATVNNKSIESSVKKFSKRARQEMETLSKAVDLRYLLGLLNSKYASTLLTNIRGGDYHIYPEHIRNLPIPTATAAQQKPIVELVDKILAAKKQNPKADTSEWEAQIDSLVYQLYGLSDEEIRMVQGG